ncbi:MAG: discoidin domain-containing protein [Bacilli bacterium]|nr:discoidin domain-containing protein [Bacilli bacterium]
MRKLFISALTFFMAFGSLTYTNGMIRAIENNVEVSENGNVITLANDQISRSFTKNNGNILTSEINNKRINKALTPAEGSEDFVINTISNETSSGGDTTGDIINVPEYEYTGTKIEYNNWKATLKNASGTAYNDAEVKKLFDNNLSTHVDQYTISGHPITLEIDLKEEKTIAAMSVNKRPGFADAAYGINGTMKGYEIYSSTNGTDWTLVKHGEFSKEAYNLHKEGDLNNVGDMVYVNFDAPIKSSHLKVVQTSVAFGTAQEFTSAEVSFYSDSVEKVQKVTAPTQVIARDAWQATMKNAAGTAYDDAEVKKLFDNNLSTHVNQSAISGHPITLDINLGSKQNVSSISVDKRPGYSDAAYGTNGTMGEFVLYVSDDGKAWKMAGAGNFTEEAYGLHKEDNLFNVGNRVYANFKKTYNTQYVRLVQKSCGIGSAQEFTSSELNLYADQYKGPNWNTELPAEKPSTAILSSQLLFKDYNVEDTKTGKKLTIQYEPITVAGVTYNIAYVNVLESEDHYLRSFVEISVDDKEKAQIDYIDTDCFVLPSDVEGLWSIPDESQISSMWIGKHELMLGQPIYVNGLFMGSEFPAAETDVVKNATQIRYYSGKTFAKMETDNQLTKDGKFVSWQTVIGAADGVDTAVVQTSFFSYIEDIATPTEFRKQYNSWYDNMMNITDESIASSFLGAEAGLSAEGVEPLDSYVVDDGWNNYYSTDTGTADGKPFVAPGSSAGSKTPNQTGFWEFNNKFPNELYTSSSLVDKFKSTFGVWVGPQGGYNYFGGFADFLEHSGTGEAQANSALGKVVCTGSRKYLKNFEKMAIDYQDRFNVEYWKWDGFASRPCNNKNHDHMVGGDNNMYFTSDMWEAWIDLFDKVRENNPNIFINATCYVNLSPWLLQWVNTVWVQDSGDTGQAGTGERHEQKIYYRDQVYYQLYKQNQIQFPLKNIYNHDPIYGVSDGSNATTEVFREYLFANAVRGTAFWELYYSPSLMDEAKWKVSADALEWAEKNHDILKNAKLFGSKAPNGVYGYSSWKGNDGIISFTNPLDTEQTYSLKVNNLVGAPTSISNLTGVQVEPYEVGVLDKKLSYDDELTVTLKPHETKILQFGNNDTTKLEVVSVNNVDNTTIRVKFNERINKDGVYAITTDAKASIDVESATLLDDYRTVELKLKNGLFNESESTKAIQLSMDKIVDAYGNKANAESITFKAYSNGVIADMSTSKGLALDPATGNEVIDINKTERKLSETGVEGTGVFGVSFTINTKSNNASILAQKGEVEIAIDENGFLVAKIGSQNVSSRQEVTTVDQKAHGLFNTANYVPTTTTTAVQGAINDGKDHAVVVSRSANGMLKMFIDGTLAGTTYDVAKVNESLTSKAIMIGSTGLDANLSNLKVVNAEINYDSAAALVQESAPVKEKAADRSKWTASACSEMPGMEGDASAAAAIDGNTNSWWHSNWAGLDTHPMGEHFLTIDFGEEISFDNFVYTGRGSVSNGSIKGYKLEAKVGNEWKTIKEGEMSEETTTTITLDSTITTSGVRLIPTSTHNGQNFAAAVEINVTSFDKEIIATDVQKVYDAAKLVFDAMDEEAYTESSFATYKKAVDKLNELNTLVKNGSKTTQFVLDKLVSEVETAKNNLKEKAPAVVDKEALLQLINEASKLDENDYKTTHWNEFTEALEKAVSVNADSAAKQKDVEKAKTDLQNAIDQLVERVNNTELKTLVKNSEAYQESNYTAKSWKVFKEAMENANTVLADRDASETDINDAVSALTSAVKNLKADKGSLGSLIDKAEKADLTDKTESSIEVLKTAIANAKTVFEKEDATVEEITLAVQNLEKAIAGLTDKTKPIVPDTGTNKPSNGTNTGDTSNATACLFLLAMSGSVLVLRKKYQKQR